MFLTEKRITRTMVQSRPETLFVFGDNIKGSGLGGQARAMRGEPNAIGIPTKWVPTKTEKAFFTDDDFPEVRVVIEQRFKILSEHLSRGGDVVWPVEGIGTGLAELPQRAPRIYRLISAERDRLEKIKTKV